MYVGKTYTQFATWAAHTIRCRWLMYGYSKRVRHLFEALATGTNHGHWRVKRGDVGGPWANVKNWRCEPLSFAYFSLRRQRKVGAAPHRGDA